MEQTTHPRKADLSLSLPHRLISLLDHMAFVWFPLYPAWASPLRSPYGHLNYTHAAFIAREPQHTGVFFGKN